MTIALLASYLLVLAGGGYLGYRWGRYVEAKAKAVIAAVK